MVVGLVALGLGQLPPFQCHCTLWTWMPGGHCDSGGIML